MINTKQKIALARVAQKLVMAVRGLIGLGANAQVERGGVKWHLDLREGIDFSIWLLGAFEPETVRCYKRIVQPNNVVLDIGANIGAHTLFLAKSVGPAGRVLAFEPTDYAFSKLSNNCALNPNLASRIECMQIMLVDANVEDEPTPGLYSSWPLKEEMGAHDLHQGRLMSTTGAKARTLDSIVFSMNLERVDCIKLDIDGYECGMLRGARGVLSRWRPIIIMELAPYALEEQGASLEELIQILKEFGYQLFSLSNEAPLLLDSMQLQKMIPRGASLNVLAKVPTAVT